MILWGLIVGAAAGLFASSEFGLVFGAMFGAAAGWGLRKAVRHEVAAMLAARVDAPVEKEEPRAPMRGETRRPGGIRVIDRPAEPPVSTMLDERGAQIPAPPPAPEPVVPLAAETIPARTEPSVPAEPNLFERGFAAARDWLLGGNTIVRAGLVVLFIGLAFLARWAAGAGLLPIEIRLALVAAAGIALLVIGFNRRRAKPGFALALQGGGVAILYLTIFAAAALYPILPLPAAFALMVLVCIGAVALALLQDAQGLAAAAFAGGYAVPLLLSSGGGQVAVMFAYHALLNLAVLALAWKRAWRAINLIGFAATFGIAALWGGLSYTPEHFPVAESFLILSIAIYLAIAILYARNSATPVGRFVDSSLLFGVGLIGFGLQAGLVAPYEYGAALSALGFGAAYLILATAVMRRGGPDYRLLAETMLAIGIGFATIAIPLALGAEWTGSAWALEGAGAFWVGMRQGRWMPRAFGIGLQLLAALMFLAMLGDTVHALPIVNPLFLTGLLVALPIMATAWWLRAELPHSGSSWAKAYAEGEKLLGTPAFLLGFLIWGLALIAEIGRSTPAAEAGRLPAQVFADSLQIQLAMLALVASAWQAAFMGRRRDWPVATWPGRATLVFLIAGWFGQTALGQHLLYHPGWAIWIMAAGLHLHLLRANDGDAASPGARFVQRLGHVGSVWLGVLLIADMLWLGVEQGELWDSSWAGVIFLVSAVIVLAALTAWTGRAASLPSDQRGWPLDRRLADYQAHAPLPIAALVYLGSLAAALIAEGDAAPLPYVPLINPVELTLALALAALVLWRRGLLAVDPSYPGTAWLAGRGAWLALAGLGFVEVNMMWLRFAHHYLNVGWYPDALLGSTVVQSGITILWTLLALGLMLFAHRRAERPAWIAGAALLVIVVLKLFFVDLSNASGGARIVTFIVVGVLMLVVGYFAPLPPREREPAGEATA